MATLLYVSPEVPPPVRQSQPDVPQKRYWSAENVQHVVTLMTTAAKYTVTPKEVVKRFLYDVVDVVRKPIPFGRSGS